MEINDTNVQVLYDFEYSTKDGQKITIKEGEKLLLIKKTNNDWWQVIRSNGRRPFYVPSTYVRIIDTSPIDHNNKIIINDKKPLKSPSSAVGTPPVNFVVSVNIKPPGSEESHRKFTKILLNSDENSSSSQNKISLTSTKSKSGYSQVVLPSKPKKDTVSEANILDDLSGSLAEMVNEIKFSPAKKSSPTGGLLKHSGSFKTNYEKKLLLTRSFSGSTPDLSNLDNTTLDDDVSRIKSVEEFSIKSDEENNILVKGLKPIINIKSMNEIAEKLEKNMSRFLLNSRTANNMTNYIDNNNLKDSTDSVESGSGKGAASLEDTEGSIRSSSDSIEIKPRIPVAKPRISIKPKEEAIYANTSEVLGTAAHSAATVAAASGSVGAAPSGWTSHLDTVTQLTSFRHPSTGDKWHSASDARTGRTYYFRENSSESSWTLPTLDDGTTTGQAEGGGTSTGPAGSGADASPDDIGAVLSQLGGTSGQPLPPAAPRLSTSSPEPPHPLQISEEMTALFNKISNIEVNSRKLRNAKAYSLMIPNKKEDPPMDMTASLRGWPELSDGRMPVVCEGPLNYTKICEGGKRARKSWTPVYVVLNQLFLLIYKDIKAFHSFKAPPELTLDLNGAEVSSGEKVSGRKHVLTVSSPAELGHRIALQAENINSALHWATNIQQTINTLPKASEHVKSNKLNMISEDSSAEENKKSSSILRSKSVNLVKSKEQQQQGSMEELSANSAERQVKIRARLKKFFHKRPTMEALVKKGIWKDEAVFGSHLEQACSPASSPRVPVFVQKCIQVIESSSENMRTDGLYRASGNLSQIQKIRLQIDQHNYSVLEKEEDVHVLTGALKLFFRELKEPLIPYKLFSKAIRASTTQNKKERINMFQDIVKHLPNANKDTLKFLLQHLLRVTQLQEFNRMHVANLAIVFGPTLMWPEVESSNMALDLMQQNMVIEALLLDYQAIFK